MTDENGHYANPLWSPDGTMLAFMEYGKIHVVPLGRNGRAKRKRRLTG